VTEMTPPQAQLHLLVSRATGNPLIFIADDAGDQGAMVTGMQGAGAPMAAMTAGLLGAEQTPKGGIFTTGANMVIVATGIPFAKAMVGTPIRTPGAAPKAHLIVLPSVRTAAMSDIPWIGRIRPHAEGAINS
jgi:hypothetical protein